MGAEDCENGSEQMTLCTGCGSESDMHSIGCPRTVVAVNIDRIVARYDKVHAITMPDFMFLVNLARHPQQNPTIIKEFPGQAVEKYRKTHDGKLPSE